MNCDIYVLNDLQYEMILKNICLSKLNFEISGNGLKVLSKRNKEKNYTVNMIAAVPLKIPKLDTPSDVVNIPMAKSDLWSDVINIPMTIPGLRSNSYDTPIIEGCLADTPKYESVYLAEMVNSFNINEINLTHITDCDLKELT